MALSVKGEFLHDFGKERVHSVFLGYDWALHTPIDADHRVVPADATIVFFGIRRGALVNEERIILETHESMSESCGDPKLFVILG